MHIQKNNLVILEFVYNGYFGKGNNINHHTLSSNGLFNAHPYNVEYSIEQFKNILNLGKVNVNNVIV